jgi:hypothetical protein
MDPVERIRSSAHASAIVDGLIRTFEEVWEGIGHNFMSQQAAEDARDRLARVILAYADNDPSNTARIKSMAKLVMVMNFPGITQKE